MKRRVFKLLLFLLAGAIINVAVAWGCAMVRGNIQISRFWTADDTSVQQRAKEFGYSADFIHEQIAPRLRVESYCGGQIGICFTGWNRFTSIPIGNLGFQ